MNDNYSHYHCQQPYLKYSGKLECSKKLLQVNRVGKNVLTKLTKAN